MGQVESDVAKPLSVHRNKHCSCLDSVRKSGNVLVDRVQAQEISN